MFAKGKESVERVTIYGDHGHTVPDGKAICRRVGLHYPPIVLPRERPRHLFRLAEGRINPRRERANTVRYLPAAMEEHGEDRLRPRCATFGRSADQYIAFSGLPCGPSLRRCQFSTVDHLRSCQNNGSLTQWIEVPLATRISPNASRRYKRCCKPA